MNRLIGRATKTVLASMLLAGLGAQASEPEAVPGEFIVKFKDSAAMNSSLSVLSAELGSYVKDTIPAQNIVVIKRPVFEIQSTVVKSLAENPNVEIVEPNFIYRINRAPNDPMYAQMWGLKNIGQKDSSKKDGVAGMDINVEKAWDITTGSRNVIIAVIDTGVDFNHPDLKDNMWTNDVELNGQPGVDDDNNGIVDDIYGANFVNAAKPTGNPLDDQGHGSHCAGVIGARGDDAKGIVGVAWNTRIMAVKFLSASGSGSLDGALKAVDYATQMGARMTSNSWGGGGASETLKQAIERSHAAGSLFIAAAGNNGANNDTRPTYPANYEVPNILTVAAVDNRGQIASFSNFGSKTVHVGAPGVNVYSAVKGGGYQSMSGTSMATPHVSGAAVLLASNEPNLTNLELKARIMQTSRPIVGLKGKVSNGMLDAYAMLTNTLPPPDANDPANWATLSLNVSSVHPYPENASEVYEVTVPGAKQFALYFGTFETEANYDKVQFFDAAGTLLGTMSGKNNETYSPTFNGDYVKIVLTSDKSVNSYGFDIEKAAWR